MNEELYEKMLKVRDAEDFTLQPSKYLVEEFEDDTGETHEFELRTYQKQMVYHTLMMKRFIIGDGTGLGKSLMSIANQCYLWERESDLKPIVVTRKSAIGQWSEEIDKFTTDEIGWTIVKGKPEDRIDIYRKYFESDQKQFLIVNYARLRNDERYFREFSKDCRYVMIGDEITAVKNTKTKTHKMMRALVDRSERAYGLTATLIKNNLEEGFGIFKVMQPELFPTKKGFLRDFCVTRRQRIPGRGGGRRYIEIIVGHKKEQIKKFRERIDPYYLGRPKHEVAKELPVLTTKTVKAPISTSQASLYEEALSGLLTVNKNTEEEEDKETTALTQLIYTQQIVNSPHLIGREGKSGKEQLFFDLLEGKLSGQKVVVFTRFREMVHRLEELLEQKGYVEGIIREGKSATVRDEDELAEHNGGFVRVTGKDEDEQRTAARQAFAKSDHTNLIFITMAGSDAINLQQAEVMLFYDMPWSAGDQLQILGRMIRIGSPHQRVYAMNLVAEGKNGEETIDHHVMETLNTKMGYIEEALGKRLVTADESELEDPDEIVKVDENPVNELFDRLKEDAEKMAS